MLKTLLLRALPQALATPARQAWRELLRYQRNGWKEEMERRRLRNAILSTPPQRTDPVGSGEAALCLMCCQYDWEQAIWALKSFYAFFSSPLPLYLRLQGPMTAESIRELSGHFPDARLIGQREADDRADQELIAKGLNTLGELRQKTVHLQKLTDFPTLCSERRLFIMDSDILFFAEPRALRQAIFEGKGFYFQADHIDAYVLTPEDAKQAFQVELRPKLNVGMMVFPREAIDLRLADEWLRHPVFVPHYGTPHIEQTLWALLAEAKSTTEVLPETYYLSLDGPANPSGLVARHYVSPVRNLMYDEGMAYLRDKGFLN